LEQHNLRKVEPMNSGEITFGILIGTVALIFGFASLPRGFLPFGIIAAIAALAAAVLLEG
jgi:hypothetical protein